jgi:hypothetical protein
VRSPTCASCANDNSARVTVSAQLAANRFEAAFITVPHRKRWRQEDACLFTAARDRFSSIAEIWLSSTNIHGGMGSVGLSAKVAATPKRLPILTPAARKCNPIFTSSLQISYKISRSAIFGSPEPYRLVEPHGPKLSCRIERTTVHESLVGQAALHPLANVGQRGRGDASPGAEEYDDDPFDVGL